MSAKAKNSERLERALVALDGLSVGDSFGAWSEMMQAQAIAYRMKERKLPDAPWRFTDDTNMALSIVSTLRHYEHIEQDELAASFGKRFDSRRGYGMGARNLLSRIQMGQSWRELAPKLFPGGSFGNGGAMRVAPLGAYFADDLEAAIDNARLSAEITHSHPEGIAGTITVAIGAAIAARQRDSAPLTRQAFIAEILPAIPDSAVREGLLGAQALPVETTAFEAANALGNGSRVSAQDTVPYTLWCAGEYFADYEEAMWQTLSGGGDTDTTCAMVGGIVAAYTGRQGIPAEWLASREALPDWFVTGERG